MIFHEDLHEKIINVIENNINMFYIKDINKLVGIDKSIAETKNYLLDFVKDNIIDDIYDLYQSREND